jgi:16S rRNA (guanine1207-N2)-methyltransferase
MIELALPDVHVDLVTDRGVFSPDRIDAGTKHLLLAATAPDEDARDLVDVGCGYGPVAVALALRAPSATVWAVDVNERARALCAENAARAGCTNVRVIAPDAVPDDLRVDAIYSNPPIRIGKAALHDLLETWLARVRPEGHAHLVVQKHLGADSLARWLEEEGYDVTRVASRAGYRILDVTQREDPK